jgi:hypothetical protein
MPFNPGLLLDDLSHAAETSPPKTTSVPKIAPAQSQQIVVAPVVITPNLELKNVVDEIRNAHDETSHIVSDWETGRTTLFNDIQNSLGPKQRIQIMQDQFLPADFCRRDIEQEKPLMNRYAALEPHIEQAHNDFLAYMRWPTDQVARDEDAFQRATQLAISKAPAADRSPMGYANPHRCRFEPMNQYLSDLLEILRDYK